MKFIFIYIHRDDYIFIIIFRWFNVAQFSVLVMTFQQQTMLFTFRILVCYKIIIFIINNMIICCHSTISTCQIQSAHPNTVRWRWTLIRAQRTCAPPNASVLYTFFSFLLYSSFLLPLRSLFSSTRLPCITRFFLLLYFACDARTNENDYMLLEYSMYILYIFIFWSFFSVYFIDVNDLRCDRRLKRIKL